MKEYADGFYYEIDLSSDQYRTEDNGIDIWLFEKGRCWWLSDSGVWYSDIGMNGYLKDTELYPLGY